MVGETAEIFRIEAVEPAVEGVPRDAKVRAGQTGGAVFRKMEQPLQALRDFFGHLILKSFLNEDEELAFAYLVGVDGERLETVP